ncbi:MAG: hypothetical protein ACXAD7_18220 [Candidatus Kariarchaeaceae archaeon]|jgi:Leucine-rich repeat (LRR) protein
MVKNREIDSLIYDLDLKKHSRAIITSKWTKIEENGVISIDLSGLSMKTIPKGIFYKYKQLKYLFLHRNNFNAIPKHIFSELKQLRGLNFAQNKISKVSQNDFKHMKSGNNLVWMNLSSNQISKIPSHTFSSFNALRTLNLSHNKISRLDEGCFYNLSKLVSLRLDHNSIKSLDAGVFIHLAGLKKLILSHNKLETLELNVFHGLNKLEEVDLSHNMLREFDKKLCGLSETIQSVNLSSNRFKEMPESKLNDLSSSKLLVDHINENSTTADLLEPNTVEFLNNYFEESSHQGIDLNSVSMPNQERSLIPTKVISPEEKIKDFEIEEFLELFQQLLHDPRFDGGIGKVSNATLSKRSGKSIDEVSRIVENLVLQELIVGIRHEDSGTPNNIDDDYWITMKQNNIIGKNKNASNRCLICQFELDNIFDKCPNCDLRCEICKLAIKEGEDWDTCSSNDPNACNNIFHRNEFVEWVKLYEKCPSCLNRIDLHLYDLTKQYSDKIKSLVVQDLEITTNSETEYAYILPITVHTIHLLYQIYDELSSTQQLVKNIEVTAAERHNDILKELQPLTKEIVLIRSFSESIERGMLTKNGFIEAIEEISVQFNHVMDNLELIVNSHKKDKGRLDKLKKSAKGKGKNVGVDGLVERTGLKSRILRYIKKPNLSDLKHIMNRIKDGIANKSADPSSWINLSVLFLI